MALKSRKKVIKERRRYERFQIPIEVKYRVLGRDEKERKANCVDISGGGLGVSIKEHLDVGDKLEISLYIAGKEKPIIVMAQVVWDRECEGGFRTGLKFLEINNKEGFVDFICDKLLEVGLIKEGGLKKGG